MWVLHANSKLAGIAWSRARLIICQLGFEKHHGLDQSEVLGMEMACALP